MEITVESWFTVDGFVTGIGGDWLSPEAGGGSGGGLFVITNR